MPRKSCDTLTNQLFETQRRATLLGTDPEWQINNRASLDIDLPGIQAAYVVLVRITNKAPAKRLASFRSHTVIYRARLDSDTLLMFCNDPTGLMNSLTPAARNDGIDNRMTYGLFDGTFESIEATLYRCG